jgi:hypothetical protein
MAEHGLVAAWSDESRVASDISNLICEGRQPREAASAEHGRLTSSMVYQILSPHIDEAIPERLGAEERVYLAVASA